MCDDPAYGDGGGVPPPDELTSFAARALYRTGAPAMSWDDGGAVVSEAYGSAECYGAPPRAAADRESIRQALAAAGPLDVHMPEGAGDVWREALGLRGGKRAVLHLRDGSRLADPAHPVRQLEGPDDPALGTLPRALVRELTAVDPFPLAFAAFAGDAVASVAYVFLRSERFSDLSVDTVSEFRRAGFATAACSALVDAEEAAGLQAVWGAHVGNGASNALARRLGFQPTHSIVVARSRTTGPRASSSPG